MISYCVIQKAILVYIDVLKMQVSLGWIVYVRDLSLENHCHSREGAFQIDFQQLPSMRELVSCHNVQPGV